MFRVFNAFQLVTLFASLPFVVGWLYTKPFPYSQAAFWTAIATYIILYIANIVAVSEFVKDSNGRW